MSQRQPLIIANNFHPPTIAILDRDYDTVHLWELSYEEKIARLSALEGKCSAAASASWTTDPLLYSLRSLEMLACFGVGVDGIDFEKTKIQSIKVSNTPGVLDDAVADLALGLILACTRKLVQADAFVRSGDWRHGPFPFGQGLTGKTLGIAGLGRIGRAIASRALNFKMKIAYHNRRRQADNFRYAETLEELASISDIVVNVLPGGIETQKIIGKKFFDKLGPAGYFINVGRGQSVDEHALVEALLNNTIAGAGLDVYEQEPNVPEALVELGNVVLLPHIGSSTAETRMAMGDLVRENLAAYFSGQTLPSEYPQD